MRSAHAPKSFFQRLPTTGAIRTHFTIRIATNPELSIEARLHQLSDRIDQRRAAIISFQYRLDHGRNLGGIQLTGTSHISRVQGPRQPPREDHFPKSPADLLRFTIDWFGEPVLAAKPRQDKTHMLTQLISGRRHRSTPSEHIRLSMASADREIVMVTLRKVVNCTGSKRSLLHLPPSTCIR